MDAMVRLLIVRSQTDVSESEALGVRREMREGLGRWMGMSRSAPSRKGGLSGKSSNGAIEKIPDPFISDDPFFSSGIGHIYLTVA